MATKWGAGGEPSACVSVDPLRPLLPAGLASSRAGHSALPLRERVWAPSTRGLGLGPGSVCLPSAPTARLRPHPRVAPARSSAPKAAYLVENSWAECPQCRVFVRVLPSLPGPRSLRHEAGWAWPASGGREHPTRCSEEGGLAVTPVGVGPRRLLGVLVWKAVSTGRFAQGHTVRTSCKRAGVLLHTESPAPWPQRPAVSARGSAPCALALSPRSPRVSSLTLAVRRGRKQVPPRG